MSNNIVVKSWGADVKETDQIIEKYCYVKQILSGGDVCTTKYHKTSFFTGILVLIIFVVLSLVK